MRRALARAETLHWPTIVVAVLAGIATMAIVAISPLRFAYDEPGLRVALETSAAGIALVASYLVAGRFLRGRRLDTLLLAFALGVLAVANLVLTITLALSPDSDVRRFSSAGSLAGSLLMVAAAFAPRRPLQQPRRAVLRLSLAVLALLVLLTALFVGIYHFFPLDAAVLDADPRRARIGPHRGLLTLQALRLVAFALAAIGFARRSVAEEDPFIGFVAAGTTLAAFGRLHYVLFPPVHSDWVHTGDLFRLLFYIVLLAGAAREIEQYWRGLAGTAVLEERRRLARELHDGVAQELAFIRRRAERLAGQPGAHEIVVAAERALRDSRWAIDHLARAPDEPLERVLARHAAAIAARTGVAVTFVTIGTTERVGPEVSEALARILGEAVTNARHGNATLVHIELSTHPLRLRVIDDGTGFDTTASATGFGLGGMRERAALVGAELSVRSGPGAGTEVAVELP